MPYVVVITEHLRDGTEEGAAVFNTLDEALECVNADRFARDNHTFRLFELGRELPLDKRVETREQVTVRTRQVYRVKGEQPCA